MGSEFRPYVQTSQAGLEGNVRTVRLVQKGKYGRERTGNVAEDGQEKADEELMSAFEFEKHAQWWQKNCQQDGNNINSS